jgi:2'-5' RNA ligase
MVSELRHLSKSIKWVRPENLHLTLKFLGEVEEANIPELLEKLREVTATCPPLMMKAHGTGAFPSSKRPRVIWAGLEAQENLMSLQSDIESALVPLGFTKEEKQFNAHLTIGRVKSQRGLGKFMNKLDTYGDNTFGEFTTNEVVLYKSDLKPTGAEYTAIEVFPLG